MLWRKILNLQEYSIFKNKKNQLIEKNVSKLPRYYGVRCLLLFPFSFFFPQKKKEKKVFTLYTPKKVFQKFMENSLPLITESRLFFYAQQRWAENSWSMLKYGIELIHLLLSVDRWRAVHGMAMNRTIYMF